MNAVGEGSVLNIHPYKMASAAAVGGAGSPPVEAADPSEDPPKYWYLFHELAMTRGSDHLPLIKAHLQALYEVAYKTVEGMPEGRTRDAAEEHLAHIFTDRTVSITSLNIKSLQCAVLFRILQVWAGKIREDYDDPHVGGEEFLLYIGVLTMDEESKKAAGLENSPTKAPWDSYESMLYYAANYKTEYLLREDEDGRTVLDDEPIKDIGLEALILADERPDVYPELNDKMIVTLLGDLSLFELNRSLADNLYILALSPTPVLADGYNMDSLTFLFHDAFHRKQRRKYSGTTPVTRGNVKRFLDSALYRDLTDDERHVCDMWIFLITHELLFQGAVQRQEEYFLSGPIGPEKDIHALQYKRRHVYVLDKIASDITTRESDRLAPALKGVLPPSMTGAKKADVVRWLGASWLRFVSVWNSSFERKISPADAPGSLDVELNRIVEDYGAVPRHIPEPTKWENERIQRNAEKWNAAHKRTRKRRRGSRTRSRRRRSHL
jgi:hypothetical protein